MVAATTFTRIFSSDAFATIAVASAVFTKWSSFLLAAFGAALFVFNGEPEPPLSMAYNANKQAAVAGSLTNKFRSKKVPFLLGLVLMVASSLLFFMSTHIAGVVTARAIQGASTAFVWVSGLAYLTIHVEGSNLGAAMSWVTMGSAAGELAGPVVGGVVYEVAGHYNVMLLVMIVLGVDVVLRVLLIDKSRIDQPCSETTENEDQPLLNGNTNSHYETTGNNFNDHKMNPDDQDLAFLGASLFGATITGIVRFAMESVLVIFVVQQYGWSVSASGSIMFALLAPSALSPLIARMTTRYGPRWISVGSFTLICAAFLVLGLVMPRYRSAEAGFFMVIIAMGTGLAVLTTSHTVIFSTVAKRREDRLKYEKGASISTGMSFGALNTAWAVGMFVGPLAADGCLEYLDWTALCICLASVCFASSVICAWIWRKWQNESCKTV